MRNWLRRLTPIALFLTSSAIRFRSNENWSLPLERSTRSIYARKLHLREEALEFGIQAKGEVAPDAPSSGGAGAEEGSHGEACAWKDRTLTGVVKPPPCRSAHAVQPSGHRRE